MTTLTQQTAASRPVYLHSGVERSSSAVTATVRIGRHVGAEYVADWSIVICILPGTAPYMDAAGQIARYCGTQAAIVAANGYREPTRAQVETWLREVAREMSIHPSRLVIVRCGALP